jgi:hypothetical protein
MKAGRGPLPPDHYPRAHAVEIRVASSDQSQDASKNHATGGTESCRSSGARPAVGVVPRARRGVAEQQQ